MARVNSLASKLAVGKSVARSDQVARERFRKAVANVSDIKDRPHGDLRPVRAEAVAEILRSIHDIGLIEPIVVDRNGCLLAGLHRRTAIELLVMAPEDRGDWLTQRTGRELSEEVINSLTTIPARPELGVVQVGIREDVDADYDPDLARKIEASENVVRTNFTNGEIEQLATKLVGEGKCRPLQFRGRPDKGDTRMAVTRAVAVALGVSERHVQRVLRTAEKDIAASPPPERTVAPLTVHRARRRLRGALEVYLETVQETRIPRAEKKAAEELARQLAADDVPSPDPKARRQESA